MKTLILVVLFVTILVVPVFAYPVYTAPIGGTGRTYGGTGIPAVYYDETGQQLFDGDYGMFDWIIREQPSTPEQYWGHYDDQKGYGYSWVGWGFSQPTITFDMGQQFSFTQIGIHAYDGRDIHCPSSVVVSFSNDGINPIASASALFDDSLFLNDDNVFWLNQNFSEVRARYAKITLTGYQWMFIDEISINGMDGAQFAASVPEPSTLIALGALLTPLFFRRRR